MTEDVKKIYNRLKELLSHAHAPYSDFMVSAAVVDEDGDVHFGVNVENQSFPVGTCAEAGAITALRVAGKKHIKKLYLLSKPNIEVLPCGACRQRVAELGDPESTGIATFREDGSASEFTLGKLLPHAFKFR
jgi:cytidine deaminase